eukprot:4167133-Pleurochrysis_carterae.AAC.2
MRQEDSPRGTRTLSRALRAHHFRRLLQLVDWQSTAEWRMKWVARYSRTSVFRCARARFAILPKGSSIRHATRPLLRSAG